MTLLLLLRIKSSEIITTKLDTLNKYVLQIVYVYSASLSTKLQTSFSQENEQSAFKFHTM